MSGHSKWHNIQAKKGKADAARGRIFTKLGREISSVESKINAYEKGKKALEEVNSVIDLIEENAVIS